MMFLKRAGTTIFSMMVMIWFLASFPRPPEGAAGPAIDYSFAAVIGKWLEPLTAPVGFNWQINVALIPGMAAREVAVASLGTVYAIEGGKEAPSRSARRSPTSGASPPRWRCWSGTFSRRSAHPRSPSSSARPEAGSGCSSPLPTCWRWPISRRSATYNVRSLRSAPGDYRLQADFLHKRAQA
jgi:hypothetical protein